MSPIGECKLFTDSNFVQYSGVLQSSGGGPQTERLTELKTTALKAHPVASAQDMLTYLACVCDSREVWVKNYHLPVKMTLKWLATSAVAISHLLNIINISKDSNYFLYFMVWPPTPKLLYIITLECTIGNMGYSTRNSFI